MKKIILIFLSCFTISSIFAQETAPETPTKQTLSLTNRSNDHLLFQVGYAGWAGAPDSINIGGLSKSVNLYFMFDFPFKSNPKMSVAVGVGIGSDNIKFKKTFVDIKGTTSTLRFQNQEDTNHFKRSKLSTNYFEAPVELRYTLHPEKAGSLKFALGLKVGALLNAHTRYKTLQNKSGNTINEYTLKEASKVYYNKTRIAGTARIGLGHFSVFGSYQLTSLFKDGVTAQIRPYTIGLTLSGL